MDQAKDAKPEGVPPTGPVARKEGRRKRLPTSSITVSPLREGLPEVAKKRPKAGKASAKGVEARILVYQGSGGACRAFAGLAALAAAKARGDEFVEVLDFGPMTQDEARELVLLFLLGDERGSPFQIAVELARFQESHSELSTTRDLGAHFGRSHTAIERYISLLKLPASILKAGLNGKIRPSHAYLLPKVKDEGDLQQIAQALIEGDKDERKRAASALRALTRPAKPQDGYADWQRIRGELVRAWHTCASEDRPRMLVELRDLLTSLDPGGAPEEVADVA